MKKFLQRGVNVFQNDTGDYVVHFDQPLVTIKDRTYNSTDAFLSDLYNTVFTTLSTLISESQELKGNTKKHTKPMPNTAAFYLVHVKGLDGQTKWVRRPVHHKATAKKPSAPPPKKQAPVNNGYVWSPTDVQQPATPPAAATYRVMPTSAQAGQSTETPQEYTPPVTPQSSTYVAPVYHAEMLKPGEALSDIQIANFLFPAVNENITFSVNLNIGAKGINPPVVSGKSDDLLPKTYDADITKVSSQETGFDIGLIKDRNITTEKDFYQELDVLNPATGKVDKIPYTYFVKEEKSYKSVQIDGVGILEEVRAVYVDDKLVISQYRYGFAGGKEKKLAGNKKIGANVGIEIDFDMPWMDNPIPKEIVPTIDVPRY